MLEGGYEIMSAELLFAPGPADQNPGAVHLNPEPKEHLFAINQICLHYQSTEGKIVLVVFNSDKSSLLDDGPSSSRPFFEILIIHAII